MKRKPDPRSLRILKACERKGAAKLKRRCKYANRYTGEGSFERP